MNCYNLCKIIWMGRGRGAAHILNVTELVSLVFYLINFLVTSSSILKFFILSTMALLSSVSVINSLSELTEKFRNLILSLLGKGKKLTKFLYSRF